MSRKSKTYVLCQKCLDKIEEAQIKWVSKKDFVPHQYAVCEKCYNDSLPKVTYYL